MTTKATSFMLSVNSQKRVIQYLQARYSDFPIEQTRERLEKIDKALQLESDKRNKARDDYYSDTEIPTVRGPISKLSNFLIDTFVGTRIFEAVSSDPQQAPAVRQFNTVMEENAAATNWVRNLVMYFRDIGKYPYAAISCDWEREEVMSILSDSANTESNSSGAAIKTVGRAGNTIKRKDLYNCFYDTSVDLNEVHSKGEFSAEIKRMSQIGLYRLISNLKIGGNTVLNQHLIWGKASTSPNHYYRPSVLPINDKEEHIAGWGNGFFQSAHGMTKHDTKKLRALGKGARYEVICLNARIIPSMFGIAVPGADTIQVWKFYILNWDTVIYAERQSNAHSYLPDVYTQVSEEGIGEQSKSFAELVIPIQNLSTNIFDVELASMKRAVSDRALYDSSRISFNDANHNDPSHKIGVTPNMLKGSLQDAYYPIPFRDDGASTRFNTLNFLGNIGNEIAGFNRPQQGQFQKGNKTLGEYNDVMNNADDDLRTIAKLVETVAFVPIKTMIKTNMLQFQTAETLDSPSDGQQVEVNPAEIRRASMTFKLADGLVDKQQMLDLPTANNMLQLVLQLPQLQQRYDVAGLVNHVMSSVGFDTSKFDNGGQGGQAPAGGAPTPTPPAA